MLTETNFINVKAKERQQIFEEELYPHAEALFNFAFSLARNEPDASDLVQETYTKAFRFIDKYLVGTNAKAWLFKILKNAFINEYRKRSKIPSILDIDEVATYSEESESGPMSGFVDLRQEIFQSMMGDEITLAVNSLPVDYRIVILLCDVEDFSYEEIAKIIGAPIGTVRSRLHRARNLLKEKLNSYAKSLGYEDKRS